jgi:uncharacterized repeat protein (TIGR01451 family)
LYSSNILALNIFLMLFLSVRREKTKIMFRKLVANLPFSPALVGQLGFYAKRLRGEEATRRLGLMFTVLALIVQSFAVVSPPESANASNPADFIYGGVSSKERLLEVYDASARGNGDYKDLTTYAGITRAELAAVKETSINSQQYGTGSGAWINWGRVHRFSSSEGEVKHSVPRTTGGVSTVYSRPLSLTDTSTYAKKNGTSYEAFVGYSAKIGAFAILKDCGNIATRSLPTPAPEAAFVEVTCSSIRGFAYDSRNKGLPVSVYLYFNGPPGKGEKVGPIAATGNTNSFSYSVPDKYAKSSTSTTVWGVMVPLSGWNESTVQFKNTIKLPGNCLSPQASPTAVCAVLKSRLIDRTKVNLVASTSVANGAAVKSYTFTVKDASGKVVTQKTVTSSALEVESGTIDLKTAGKYNGSVVVTTSVGEKTSPTCGLELSVASTTTCAYNASLPKSSEDCKPCPGNPQLWIKDADCQQQSVQSKTARNLTQNAEASKVTAQPGDRIQYTVYFENIGSIPATVTFNEQLADVLEYATIQDNGGGEFNADTKVLGWGTINLAAGERQARNFVVNVKDDVPATPQGKSDPSSYDCIMTNSFGTTVNVKVNCPQVKMAETVVRQLPHTGMGMNIIFATALLATVVYFWARSRQLGKEVRLIRKDFNMGTI